MGTRSLVHFIRKEDDVKMCNLYRQYDGYPEGRGMELAKWLESFNVVNGFTLDDEKRRVANGLDCLCALWVSEEKGNEVGNVYMMGISDTDVGEEYVYEVWEEGKDIYMSCYDVWNKELLFKGTPEEYINWQAFLHEVDHTINNKK